MSERMDGWRECADPVELAAAVAAGVEVQRNWGYDWQPGTNNETAEQFAGCTKANCRYRLPVSWSWSPEPPADVPTGAERYLAERMADPEYRAAYEAAAPVTGDDLRERIAQAIWERDGWGDPWVTAGHLTHTKYRRMADAVLAVLPPQPTPPPAPPWPGAVLSGLVDEDGVPTWLAQAGQVRGEQVRRRSDFVWVNNDQMVAHLDTVWVEVRAPRAVPVPETERVQLGVAVVGGLLAICREGGTLDLGRGDVRIHTENGALVASTSESMFTVEIDPDGTVEVLKDGDR